jgi:uncharacterized protein YbjT (DUF2867 family)
MAIKTALLFGATGLVGHYLLQELIEDPTYSEVVVFSRKRISLQHEKLTQVITEFSDLLLIEEKIKGDALFCCLGSTIKKAGSQLAFRKVDYELPVILAEIASANHVNSYLVVSSIGADAKSGNFYLKTKGEMENAVSAYDFKNLVIFRPSILLGERTETRIGESIGKAVMNILSPLLIGPAKKYKPVHGKTVARAMLKLSSGIYEKKIVASDEIRHLAEQL